MKVKYYIYSVISSIIYQILLIILKVIVKCDLLIWTDLYLNWIKKYHSLRDSKVNQIRLQLKSLIFNQSKKITKNYHISLTLNYFIPNFLSRV